MEGRTPFDTNRVALVGELSRVAERTGQPDSRLRDVRPLGLRESDWKSVGMGLVGDDAGSGEAVLEWLVLQDDKPIIREQLGAGGRMEPLLPVLLRPSLGVG